MGPMNILLVDDERQCIESIAERLRQRGVTADLCIFRQGGIDLAEKNRTVDVIILDVGMPYPDGLAILGTVKKKYPIIEVIMLTGEATVHSAVAAIKLGAFDYLMKPCALEDLLVKMEQALAKKQERQAKILDARMKPFITDQERTELIARILTD